MRVPAEDCPIVIPPRQWFNGRGAFVSDPDGVWIELMGPPQLVLQRKRTARGKRPHSG
jgi:hypothetical protein